MATELNLFELIFLVQYTIIVALLYCYDLYNTIQLEKKRKWQDQYIPSWNHTRVTIFYIAITAFLYSFFMLRNYAEISSIVLSALWMIIIIDDWQISAWSAAKILMLKYGSKKNPLGVFFTIIGIILLIINYILFYLNIYHNEQWFVYIYLMIFLFVSILLDGIYINVANYWIFHTNGIVSGQIYAFAKTFRRVFFGLLHRMTTYVVVGVILLMKLLIVDDDKYLFFIQPILF